MTRSASEALDDERRQDLQDALFGVVVAELAQYHALPFVADVAWPETREEPVRLGVERRSKSVFAGPFVQPTIDALLNGGTVVIDVFAGQDPVLHVHDDLADVTAYLTDAERARMRRALTDAAPQ